MRKAQNNIQTVDEMSERSEVSKDEIPSGEISVLQNNNPIKFDAFLVEPWSHNIFSITMEICVQYSLNGYKLEIQGFIWSQSTNGFLQ